MKRASPRRSYADLSVLTILHAEMAWFDRELRNTPDWADWAKNKAHLYAIKQADQRYPVKQIASMATG